MSNPEWFPYIDTSLPANIKRRGALTVCDLSSDARTARPLLEALGLVDPLTPAALAARARQEARDHELAEMHRWMLANGYLRPVQQAAQAVA